MSSRKSSLTWKRVSIALIVVLIALLLAGAWLLTPAHAQKTKTQLNNEVNTNLPDNTVGAITPAILRATILDIISSYIDLNGANNFTCPAGSTYFTSVTLNAFTCQQNNQYSFQTYQTGPIANLASANRFTAFAKIVSQSTVDSLTGSAPYLSCSTNPVISFVECGSSNTCLSPVATLATVTVTAAGQLAQGTILSSVVTAGDYVGWIVGPGACTNSSLIGQAGMHAN